MRPAHADSSTDAWSGRRIAVVFRRRSCHRGTTPSFPSRKDPHVHGSCIRSKQRYLSPVRHQHSPARPRSRRRRSGNSLLRGLSLRSAHGARRVGRAGRRCIRSCRGTRSSDGCARSAPTSPRSRPATWRRSAAWSSRAGRAAAARRGSSSTATRAARSSPTTRSIRSAPRPSPTAAIRTASSSTRTSCCACRRSWTRPRRRRCCAPASRSTRRSSTGARARARRSGIVGLGGLGHMGVKFAHAFGAHTVLFTTSPSKIEDGKRLGADEVVISKNADEMAKHARSFDLIVNTVAASHDLDPFIVAAQARRHAGAGRRARASAPVADRLQPAASAAARWPARASAASRKRRRCSTSAPRRTSSRTSS